MYLSGVQMIQTELVFTGKELAKAGAKLAVQHAVLPGIRFTRLVVIGPDPSKHRYVQCICDCGTVKSIRVDHLATNATRSCGCLRNDNKASVTHGMRYTTEYSIWENMLKRCRNPRNKRYKSYGGRGISVCDRWLDFKNFFSDMGNRPHGLTLDRIDVNGNYEPTNCRWATRAQQAQNTTKTKLSQEKAADIRALRARGETYASLAKMFDVSEGSIGFVLSFQQWKPEPEAASLWQRVI